MSKAKHDACISALEAVRCRIGFRNARDGVYGLMAGLIMRLMECVRLRVKDIDFGYRHAPLPKRYSKQLQEHLLCVKEIHNNDLKQGFGEVYMPRSLCI